MMILKGFLAGIIFVMLVAIITDVVARHIDSEIAKQKKQIEWYKKHVEVLNGTCQSLISTLKIYGYPESLNEKIMVKTKDGELVSLKEKLEGKK